jgi:hypothetical protein
MFHKHIWNFKEETSDYVKQYEQVICHGKIYQCEKCSKTQHLGSSIIFILEGHAVWLPSKKLSDYLPTWGF